jgi:hypothetical protein
LRRDAVGVNCNPLHKAQPEWTIEMMLQCSDELHRRGLELFWKTGNYEVASRASEQREAVQV